jgi:hypothetical protein
VAESETPSLFNHPLVAFALLLGLGLSLLGHLFGRDVISNIGEVLSLGAISLLWLELIRQRQYGVIGQALAGALLLLIAVVLAALLLPGPWVWIVLTLILLGFLGLAFGIRAGRARAL